MLSGWDWLVGGLEADRVVNIHPAPLNYADPSRHFGGISIWGNVRGAMGRMKSSWRRLMADHSPIRKRNKKVLHRALRQARAALFFMEITH